MVKVAAEWFAICGGCEVTILDIGGGLVDLLTKIDIVHWPILYDHKYFGSEGEGTEIEIPKADVGIITGGIRTEKERELAKLMRDSCTTLIANGTCAVNGGVPALANMYRMDEITDYVNKTPTKDSYPELPVLSSIEVPKLTDRVYALDEVVDVDVKLPGCPTTPEIIGGALNSLIEGTPFELSEKSVCDDCPLTREKKAISELKRPLGPLSQNGDRCYLELGYLCLGPATRSGCGGSETTPRCIEAKYVCEGCFGPLREGANVMVDMMGALSSIGIDTSQIKDRRGTFNRFTGAHNILRPVRL